MPSFLKNKQTLITLLGIAISVAVLLLVLFFLGGEKKLIEVSYVIPNVPYLGIYNTSLPQYSFGDIAAASSIISNYWYNLDSNLPIYSYLELDQFFPGYKSTFSLGGELKPFFDKNGFITEYVKVSDIRDFLAFINPKRKTPLIISQQVDEGIWFCPEGIVACSPLRIITGVSLEKEVVIVHDFYMGANYEISFDKFKKLWGWQNGSFQSPNAAFLAVYPQNYEEILQNYKGSTLSAVERTDAMQITASVMLKWFNAKTLFEQDKFAESATLWEDLIEDPTFNSLPSYFYASAYNWLAICYNQLAEYDKGLENAQIALELASTKIDPSVRLGWVSLPKNRFFYIQKTLGISYLGLGQKDKALEAFEKALAIDPEDENLLILVSDLK